MRRHARRMRRYGFQPMIFINAGDRLPDLAAVVLARWAWRYRSELAPLTLAAMTVLAAWCCTSPTRTGGPPSPRATVAAAAVRRHRRAHGSAWPPAPSASTRRRHRGGTGGWLAAATAAGPWRAPLPRSCSSAALVLAVPWWAHRRRRARVRVERTLAAWPEIAQAVGPGRLAGHVRRGRRVGLAGPVRAWHAARPSTT